MTDSRWIPLESNPEVLNSWAYKVGLSPTSAEFVDIYGLDNELLGLVPQPVKAVILLFPIRGAIGDMRRLEDEQIAANGLPAVDSTIFWMKQTISNACGTMGLIHALANSDVMYEPESPLAQFIDICKDKTPLERAKILETTDLFSDVHADAAQAGQSAVPDNLDTDLHFTCFVLAPDAAARQTQTETSERRLIELDGDRAGPLDRGKSTDLLKDVAAYVKEHIIPKAPSLEFSMIALVELAK
ncbi:peptidase C12 ubiquitin carboxyl-terminal hydrolase 1 [Artomyces pyxidatus]|uniref:Peptidase C12 ubiquitin carboxyl-terminal hydrolase 1 n=1 Tax=Artomyces pyxidatus TaxID=48021 RepID=A0ACB8TBS5_9AGAM|nr:peptidase C12 ubiquitin carboxyl-terminal hydrolase 1 [Artomyces pyxidatus]